MSYIPYGFEQKPTGIFINPQQAEIVKQIYQRYLKGDSLGGIADFLLSQGISSPSGQERWTRPAISKLLSNSKYIGYIVSFDDYFAVQVEKGKRSNIDEDSNKRKTTRYSSQNVLSGLLVCGECGANYRRITRPSGEIIWRCANRVEHGKEMYKHSPSIFEEEIKSVNCNMLGMVAFDEERVCEEIDFISAQEGSQLKIEFNQKFSQVIGYMH